MTSRVADFPPDPVLIARGKYSTLGRERTEQLKRVQTICQTLMQATQQALRDCEKRPPDNAEPVQTIETCLTNLRKARETLTALCLELDSLRGLAWTDGE